jgi:putative ABC transport system substrate-binding protein
VAAAPVSVFAQSSTHRPLVGVLSPQTAAASNRNIAALRAGLSEAGFIEGQNVWLEIRYADGVLAQLTKLAAELVSANPDVIVAGSAPALVAVHNITQTIPVVGNTIQDPVALGLVKSLAKPQSNVTGIFTSGGTDALTGKRLSLLKEVVPSLSRIGVMVAADDATEAAILRQLPTTTRSLGLTYRTFEVGSSSDLETAFQEAKQGGMQALFVSQNPFFFTRRLEIAAIAARAQLPAVYGFREHAEAGGLMSYGSSLTGSYSQVARLVAKILKGAKPADLPVEQADKFELVVNNKAAKAMGLNIPDTFLTFADQVIE